MISKFWDNFFGDRWIYLTKLLIFPSPIFVVGLSRSELCLKKNLKIKTWVRSDVSDQTGALAI